MTDCPQKGRLFTGCKYEARYDIEPPAFQSVKGGTVGDAADVIKALTKRTYVRDICVRCGRTVERVAP